MSPDSIDALRSNIGDAITGMKATGTTGASFECLKQNTNTRGIHCHPPVFHEKFNEIAAGVARLMKFKIYKGNK